MCKSVEEYAERKAKEAAEKAAKETAEKVAKEANEKAIEEKKLLLIICMIWGWIFLL